MKVAYEKEYGDQGRLFTRGAWGYMWDRLGGSEDAAAELEALKKQKKQAAAEENYLEANRIKLQIELLKPAGSFSREEFVAAYVATAEVLDAVVHASSPQPSPHRNQPQTPATSPQSGDAEQVHAAQC